MLVALPKGRGVGKLVSASKGRCSVSIFFSIRRTDVVDLALNEIARTFLSPQTRVYVRDGERTRVGRVVDYLWNENGPIVYEVSFPNGKKIDYSEVDLFVRPWNAPEDPAEILAAGGAESQFLHDRRQASVVPLLGLRSAAQGLTSILSAAVDFVPHQIAAVRRVLSDPIQRYLLADEVGLGKTIEAGLIIRQHLIDNPETEVLIAAPPQICRQWRHELLNKLRLDQFGNTFEVCSHADLARVDRTPDVLVIDEAHHLVGVPIASLLSSAERLRELARNAPVLLLLSATPPIAQEVKFLALLNLLDPLTHPLDDLEGFRTKLEVRRQVGRLLLSLDPEVPGLVLRQRGADLQRSFPNDAFVQEYAPRLIAATREAPDDLPNLCSVLKEHIADSYRIHQRLIRSRRADAKGWEFRLRGPTVEGIPDLGHIRSESDPAEEIDLILTALEDWRFSAAEAVAGNSITLANAASRYREMLTALGVSAGVFREWLNDAVQTFEEESEILQVLRACTDEYGDKHRIETMVESTRRLIKALKADRPQPKIVVFATSKVIASSFHEKARQKIDSAKCYLLTADEAESGANILAAFRDVREVAILTTDQSGEEGLNLSFADAIVHLDFPLSAGRLEQRIGRLDRYGRRDDIIRQRLCLPSEDDMSPWWAWYEVLAQGFLIFNRSISDVQFLLEEIEAQAFQTLLQNGPEALVRLAPEIRSRVEEERKSQDEQYALDRIALAEDSVEVFLQALDDAETDELALERDVDHWLVDTLQVKKAAFAWPAKDPFKLEVTSHTLIPRLPWQSQLGLDARRPLTWKRRIATTQPEVTLLRPGTPLIDVIERFTRWDDRGTAFVTYRTEPDWKDDPWIGFKLCFVVEPHLEISDLLNPSYFELAGWRRAQRYFAPNAHTLYIDVNGDVVSDPELIAILKRPYSSKADGPYPRDLNLGSRPLLLAKLIDPGAFQQICLTVRDGARQWLAAQPAFAKQIDSASRSASAALDRHQNRLRRRESAGDALAREDIGLIEAILPSIREPAIRLDAMGCFIIGPHSLRLSNHG